MKSERSLSLYLWYHSLSFCLSRLRYTLSTWQCMIAQEWDTLSLGCTWLPTYFLSRKVLEVWDTLSLGGTWRQTVGPIDLGTNSSEPTSECGLRNRQNPSEPTTPFPSPQYGKSKSSNISGNICWLRFYDLWLGATRYDWLKFSDFLSGATRYEKSENLSQQKVPRILLASAFPYCGLGRCVVGSEGFSWFPSPHSLVGSDEFVPKSIGHTVWGTLSLLKVYDCWSLRYYGVATINRLLKIIGLFCKRAL